MSKRIMASAIRQGGMALATVAGLSVLLAAQGAGGPALHELARIEFVVIVNESNPMTDIGRDDLSKIFLKRSTSWPSGKTIVPVDLPIEDASRDAFSRAVLHKTINAVRAYWQQQIFSGRDVPPVEKSSEAEVLTAVKSEADAIGYVSAASILPPGVKRLTVLGIE